MFYKSLAIISLVASAVSAASPNLDIYWIDAEGGASTLIVTPAGQSMLIDTANRTPDDRDAKRIFAATQQAGLKKIDFVLTTHYHGDHVGAMEALGKADPYRPVHRSWRVDRTRQASRHRTVQELRCLDGG